MAQYHITASELKPLVQQANFNAQQLNIIHKMMRGCKDLRQSTHHIFFWVYDPRRL